MKKIRKKEIEIDHIETGIIEIETIKKTENIEIGIIEILKIKIEKELEINMKKKDNNKINMINTKIETTIIIIEVLERKIIVIIMIKKKEINIKVKK